MDKNLLKLAIIKESAELAYAQAQDITKNEYIEEYTEQFEDGTYSQWLRSWIGYMIEQGNRKAVEIMKNIIKFNLAK